jgi:glycosyltransferase involved in cell wall biosynthesis
MDLKKYGNVALYYPYDVDLEQEETHTEEWGLETYRSRFVPGKHLKNRKQRDKTFRRIMHEFKPDVLHAHVAGAAGYHAVRLAKKYNLPLVITEHSPIEISGVNHRGLAHYFNRVAYKHSDANICVSKDSQEKLSHIYPKYSFDVIYNGIIKPDYNNDSHQYYKEGYLNIVIVAVLYDLEIKGIKYLLQAMKILKEKGEKVYLHHIGGGEYLSHFENMARELEIEDICTFHGRCDRKKLYEIVNEMDFFVSASLMECSGVSVQEAMLLGKPVLGTNSGGVDSLVPEKAGRIVQKADAEAMAEGILFMKEHLGDFDRHWIQQYAEESFEIGNISLKYMSLYEKVIREEHSS